MNQQWIDKLLIRTERLHTDTVLMITAIKVLQEERDTWYTRAQNELTECERLQKEKDEFEECLQKEKDIIEECLEEVRVRERQQFATIGTAKVTLERYVERCQPCNGTSVIEQIGTSHIARLQCTKCLWARNLIYTLAKGVAPTKQTEGR